tara:strand:+ start:432 stop:734 length:303 start_codon:yes stop_codon:yes gene_type:complete
MQQNYTIRPKSRNGVTKPHFWIEGKRLESAGFVAGARYNTVTSHGSFALVLDTDGKKKVSGTVNRPIIDIVGRDLSKSLLRIGDDVLITYSQNSITVEAL